MSEAYILGGMRTPIVVKNGAFARRAPEDFCAVLLRALVERYQLKEIDQIICGNAVGTGGNITRLMALKAGVDESVPAFTVDMQCASASLSIELARAKIMSGEADLVIAGGLESSSLQPMRVYDKADCRYNEQTQGIYKVAQFSPWENDPLAMLRGAERVGAAEQVTKEELDYWTLRSHKLAYEAKKNGELENIILPIGEIDSDDGIRERMSQRLLDRLPLLLGEGTHLTAGNACLINDGAALVVLCSERYYKKWGQKPLARICAARSWGGDPAQSPRGAMRTADKLLEAKGLCYEDLTAIEFNEAFAVIDVLFERAHPSLIDRYNVFGGALAYGHPYGASGAIILLHLLQALAKNVGGLGLCSIAGAGGLGTALLVEGIA